MRKLMVMLALAGIVGGLGACTVTTSGYVRGEMSTGSSMQGAGASFRQVDAG
jgi:hypothetical protein